MLPTILQILSWIAFGAAAFSAVQTSLLDRQMQAFRHPHSDLSSFQLVPLGWRQELYTGPGQVLVSRAWRAFGRMVGFFLLAALLFLLRGSAA
jgi:hypothetical protein